MSEEKNILDEVFMSETDIRALSVESLSNRPNERSGQYGRKGLTPEELKAAFSALPKAIAARLNQLVPAILERFTDDERKSIGQVSEDGGRLIFRSADGETEIAVLDISDLLAGFWINKWGELGMRGMEAVCTVNLSGALSLIRVDDSRRGETIPKRDADGNLSIGGSPTRGNHAICKSYFEKVENHPLNGEINKINKKIDSLCSAASGNIFTDTVLEGAAHTVQTDGALPYGILTKIGCSPSSTEMVIEMEETTVGADSPVILTDADGERVVFKPVFPLRVEYDMPFPGDIPLVNICWEGTDQLGESTGERKMTFTTDRDISKSDLVGYGGEDIWIELSCDRLSTGSITVDKVTVSGVLQVNKVMSVVSGIPYKLDGAAVYNGNFTNYSKKAVLTENGAIVPKGSRYGVFFPCDLPAGATVTVYADGVTSGDDTLNKYVTPYKAEAKLGNSLTLTQKCEMMLIQKADASVAFDADMEIKNVRIKFSDPDDGSILTELERIEIPEEITSLTGYGVGLDDEIYNYLDLTNKRFVRVCEIVDGEISVLDTPETVDVSAYLPDEADVITLASYGLVRFETEDGGCHPIPYRLAYQRKMDISN